MFWRKEHIHSRGIGLCTSTTDGTTFLTHPLHAHCHPDPHTLSQAPGIHHECPSTSHIPSSRCKFIFHDSIIIPDALFILKTFPQRTATAEEPQHLPIQAPSLLVQALPLSAPLPCMYYFSLFSHLMTDLHILLSGQYLLAIMTHLQF